MNRSAKPFNIGDILSITTGRLVSPRGITGVYEILNHMTGDDLFTHVLPRASRICAPALLSNHPFLAEWGSTLIAQLDALGETAIGNDRAIADLILPFQKIAGSTDLMVMPLAEGEWLTVDPIKELSAMVGEDRVIGIVV